MSNPHVLVISYPAQGHVNPLMHFSQSLANHGCKVTFVNTDFIHKIIMSAMAKSTDSLNDAQIRLVSIPDGMGPKDDRNEIDKLFAAILNTMPAKLEELIKDINSSKVESPITCVVADFLMGWAMEVADKMGIRGAVLWPASAAVLAWIVSIPKLIDDGITDCYGFPSKKQMIKLSPNMPAMDTVDFPWYCISESTTNKKTFFNYLVRNINYLQLSNWCLCNTFHELEPGTFSLLPKILPIGPLMANDHTRKSGGQFWPVDSTCLKWLDQQKPRSVIYVAFGSITTFSQTQFQELALGLELTNRPFLWAVRPEITNGSNTAFPDGFQGTRGKIIGWAPQPLVLSHPSIACFLSHCGWNSTMEGLSNGVPFLCWPYFADQFFDKSYICDVWKVGFGFEPDENGIITSEEVNKKVEQLLGNEDIRRRSLELKEMAMNNLAEDGQSSKNFNNFIKWLKA